MLAIYIIAFIGVIVGMLPDIALRFVPMDTGLQAMPGSTLLMLQQVMLPFVVSVVIPGIDIVIDKRCRKGFYEMRQQLTEFLSCQ